MLQAVSHCACIHVWHSLPNLTEQRIRSCKTGALFLSSLSATVHVKRMWGAKTAGLGLTLPLVLEVRVRTGARGWYVILVECPDSNAFQ